MTGERPTDVQSSYDRLAKEYTARIAGELAHKPFDREILDRFADLTRGAGPVLDLGCGPGHVTRHLADRSVEITGIDLSPGMIEEARALNPSVRFEQGSMLELDPAAQLTGIVAFYAIIHIPRERQAEMFRHWRDCLLLGGHVLVAFHIGDEDRHFDELWGEPVDLDFLFFTPADVEGWMTEGGLDVIDTLERDPYPGVEAETRRAYILARNSEGA
jgi:SAM-dependent methyltransferase